MEINRRHFIALLVGGAAGIQATPLPWKLTDDIAIWTQNWPWVPVPPMGEFTHAKTVCTLCPGGCGIEVRKVDHRAVKIEGRTDYPVNPGGICPLGMGGLQLLYNESIRFTGPMKRVGPRGSGKFIEITWDEALHTLASRISYLRKQGTPETLAAVDGNPVLSTMSAMIERFLKAIGSPNYVRIPSVEDTYRMTNLLMQGTEGPMAYDLENADYILSFGSGLLEGWGAPGRMINAWGLWHDNPVNRKTRIVQIESRASNTASKADQWIAPKPGTEAAMALGLAHVIIKERLYNADFVEAYSFGFNDWTSSDGKNHLGYKTMVLNKYSPGQVAEITGLNAKDVISLAKDFAGASAPIAICGKGKGYLSGSLYEFMAVQGLNALVGSINRPGGILVYDSLPLSPLPEIEKDAISTKGLIKPRLDHAGTMRYPFSQSLINNLTNAIANSPKSSVNTLLIFSANPNFTLPDRGAFRKALKKVPFIVSFSPYRDETSYMADLILPDHTYLEKTDDIVWPTGLQYPLYGISKPVVEPIYATKNSGDVIIQIAKQIGGSVGSSFPYKKYDDVLQARVKGLFDAQAGLAHYDGAVPVWKRLREGGSVKPVFKSFNDMWKKIKSGGLWYSPVHTYKNWERLFKTPTGKFEFFSTQIELALHDYAQKISEKTALNNMGIAEQGDVVFMPHYEAIKSDADREAYPLLMVPYEMINLSSGWLPSPPFLYKTLFDHQLRKDESFGEINPKTAAEYGLKEGDRVIVKSPVGKVQVRVNLFGGAMPGIVYLPLGFGHTAYDEFLRGKGVNPNDLIHAEKDPLSGHPVWWNTPVQLIKV
ncbi:MAG: molybdopterin-dependent oxidoreductase [Desulfobacteraceae bacterium]|nr:MAG: molybdopterin-dependent oxidoreductase [Desulfobacteraceae bacterium]